MTGSANPGASPELARERSRNVQGLRRDTKYPASVILNDSGSRAQRPQHNANVTSGSPLKNEKSGFQNRIVEGTTTDSSVLQRFSIECRKAKTKKNHISQSQRTYTIQRTRQSNLEVISCS